MLIITKLKSKSDIFEYSNKSLFYFFFYFFYYFFFFIYIKISKKLLAKYYQRNIERLQKKVIEICKNLSKEEKQKSNNMVVNITKIAPKMKIKLVEYIKKTL